MTQLEELKSLAKQVIEKNKKITSDFKEAKAQIEELSATLNESSLARGKLEEQLNYANTMYSEAVKENEANVKKLEEATSANAALQTSYENRYSEELNNLNELINRQKVTIDSLTEQLKNSTSSEDLAHLKDEHERAEKVIIKLNGMLKEYRTSIEGFKDEIRSHLEVESQLRDKEPEAYEWKKKLDQIVAEYSSFSEQHNKEVSGLKLQLDRQVEIATQATRRGDTLAKDLNELHARFNALSVENSKLKRDRYVGNIEDIKVAFSKDWLNKSFQTINGEVVYMPSEEFTREENNRTIASMIGIKVDGESLFTIDGHSIKSSLTLPETISTLQAMID